MTTKALWDLEESKLVPYPRYDNEPVVGLDSRYVTVDLVQETQPSYNPSEERVIQTTAIDLDALTYTYSWIVEPLPPRPDYQNFYSTLMVSACYQAILTEVLATPVQAPTSEPWTWTPSKALTLFISNMQDCLNDKANTEAVQNSIWLLLSQLNLDAEHLVELQTMLADSRLDQIYSLTPPEL